MKLSGIISVGFDVTDQLLIRSFAFVRYWKKNGSTMRQYNILIEFGIPLKLVRLIKMCLKETYSKIGTGKHLSDNFPIQNDLKQGDALTPLLFNFVLE
jgi:hypothetical protein